MTGYDRERAVPVIRWRWVLIGIIAAVLVAVATRPRAQEATVYTLAFSACRDAANCERHEMLDWQALRAIVEQHTVQS